MLRRRVRDGFRHKRRADPSHPLHPHARETIPMHSVRLRQRRDKQAKAPLSIPHRGKALFLRRMRVSKYEQQQKRLASSVHVRRKQRGFAFGNPTTRPVVRCYSQGCGAGVKAILDGLNRSQKFLDGGAWSL